MGHWRCLGCDFRTGSGACANDHRCGNHGRWEHCTCGSGGHPRECAAHPEVFAKHCAELDAIAAEEDEES